MKKALCIIMICALAIAPIFTITAAAAVPYENMIALYNMEGALKDEVSGKDGTLKNGASFVADSARGGNVLSLSNADVVSPGQGLGYDGEGQHAILADSHIPDSDAMTVSVWFKATELRTWARVIDMGDARAETLDSPNRFINIAPTNGEFTIGTVNVNDGADAGFDVPNNRDRVFADLISTDEWVHAVMVIDPKSNVPNTLYLNGKAFQSTSGGGAADDPNAATFTPKDILAAVDGIGKTYLGRSRFENNGDQIFNGFIDDVAIFNVALTADQVAELTKTDFTKGDPSKAVEAPAEAPAEVAETPADAPVAAAAPTAPAAAVTAPKTNDSMAIMLVLMGLSVIGSGIYAYAKKTRV